MWECDQCVLSFLHLIPATHPFIHCKSIHFNLSGQLNGSFTSSDTLIHIRTTTTTTIIIIIIWPKRSKENRHEFEQQADTQTHTQPETFLRFHYQFKIWLRQVWIYLARYIFDATRIKTTQTHSPRGWMNGQASLPFNLNFIYAMAAKNVVRLNSRKKTAIWKPKQNANEKKIGFAKECETVCTSLVDIVNCNFKQSFTQTGL